MDPIYLYADEVEGAFQITIGRSSDYIKTPQGNDFESPNEDLIEEIIYELQKFTSLEIKDGIILVVGIAILVSLAPPSYRVNNNYEDLYRGCT